ncbi:MAG: 1-deoxy-D-xylulose-5-phosphate reductoisomerase [Thermoleophilia bacterium]
MKRILVLGSTGSIGTQALEVIAESPGLAAVGLASGTNYHMLRDQALEHGVTDVAILDEVAGSKLAELEPDINVLGGPGCIRGLIEMVECDLVLNAIVGAAGLEATVATLEKGVDLALANKESLVVGGSLVMELAKRNSCNILPVDSEHSAIFQCLQGRGTNRIDQLFLTASGGPFFGRSRKELESVTRDDALNHPCWKMGSKISIDSATLMNKGLEVIEAHHLFNVPYDDIKVVVHPQSVVHSLVRYDDGSVLAQMGLPSMKLPIAYALNYPDRQPVCMPQLDLVEQRELTFYEPDPEAFPCLALAREAGKRGGGAPIVVNAANEVAVAAFLTGRLKFLDIADLVEKTMLAMEKNLPGKLTSLDEVNKIDAEARHLADSLLE